jgi:hypothetical protein
VMAPSLNAPAFRGCGSPAGVTGRRSTVRRVPEVSHSPGQSQTGSERVLVVRTTACTHSPGRASLVESHSSTRMPLWSVVATGGPEGWNGRPTGTSEAGSIVTAEPGAGDASAAAVSADAASTATADRSQARRRTPTMIPSLGLGRPLDARSPGRMLHPVAAGSAPSAGPPASRGPNGSCRAAMPGTMLR